MKQEADPAALQAAYDLWLENKRAGRLAFEGVYEMFPGKPETSVRSKIYHFHNRLAVLADPAAKPPAPEPTAVIGPPPRISPEKAAALWKASAARFREKAAEAKAARRLEFDYGTVALAFFADMHLGNDGTDYDDIDRCIDLVLDTPGMYIVSLGDVVDNFIVRGLLGLRMHTPVTIPEEWVLCEYALGRMAPRLLVSVAGNHDNWTYALSGVDYLREVHDRIMKKPFLYAPHEMKLEVRIGEAVHRLKLRHKWKGLSMYNPTHATERDHKFNRTAFDWTIGVAAHTHVGAYIREFNAGAGRTGHAVHCGSFKSLDGYVEQEGFPEPNGRRVPVMFLNEQGQAWGTSDLKAASSIMRAFHS